MSTRCRQQVARTAEVHRPLTRRDTEASSAQRTAVRAPMRAFVAAPLGATSQFGGDFSVVPTHGTAPPRLQAKLTVDGGGDGYEQEANAVAERIMRMPEPRVQRKCACGGTPGPTGECEACRKKRLSVQRRAVDSAAPGGLHEVPSAVHDALRAPGHALDGATRAFMEPRFGHDFSQVRIHAGAGASRAADAVQARAFTVGSDIVFGHGEFAPSSPAGMQLLAHELTHVVQQGAARHTTAPRVLQRKPAPGKVVAKSDTCPPMEAGEREEAAKAKLQLTERVPQREWLISGFPIGGTDISGAEAGRFISRIVDSLSRGHFLYVTGQDPLEVIGFSDCFAGPRTDNHALRHDRAANFCAGVKDHFTDAPKSYADLIQSCDAAPADQYVGPNATRAERAQNRSVLIRRVAPKPVQYEESGQHYPYDPTYAPSGANCAVYASDLARDALGRVYTNNAHCSCLVTPDEPHNNCVRNCLQQKMWALLAHDRATRKPGDPPMDIDGACILIWQHHRDCYHDCGCASEFINYLAFYGVCNVALPCALDSAAINVLNRCMPATANDKYLKRE